MEREICKSIVDFILESKERIMQVNKEIERTMKDLGYDIRSSLKAQMDGVACKVIAEQLAETMFGAYDKAEYCVKLVYYVWLKHEQLEKEGKSAEEMHDILVEDVHNILFG